MTAAWILCGMPQRDLAEANLLAQDSEGSVRYRDPARLIQYLPF